MSSFVPFPGGEIEQVSEQAGEERPWREQKTGRREEMSKKEDGVGRIACSQFTELRLPTNGEQKCNLIGQKFDIHALSDIWNTRQD